MKCLRTALIPPNKVVRALRLWKEMRSVAQEQPGYISDEFLKSTEREDIYIVISSWESTEYYDKWIQHSEFIRLKNEIEDLLGIQTSSERFDYKLRDMTVMTS